VIVAAIESARLASRAPWFSFWTGGAGQDEANPLTSLAENIRKNCRRR
jgi:hypothetical protein